MADKQIIIDGVDVSGCEWFYKNDPCKNTCKYFCTPCEWVEIQNCMYKYAKRKEQEYEELRQCHNKCCEENAKKEAEWLEKYNQVSRDFYNGKYCNKENCNLLKAKEQECERLKHDNGYEVGALERTIDNLKAENKILKEKFEIAIKNNMDKTLLRLEKGDVQEELQEIREQFGIETLYCHDDNTRVHRCLDVLRLKDTLTEIKEIAEIRKDDINDWLAKEILQKISEVEDVGN